MMRKHTLSAAAVLMVLSAALVVAGRTVSERRAVQPIPEPETQPHVGEMKVRKLAAMRFAYRSEKTNFGRLGETVAKLMSPLDADVIAGKMPAGSYVFQYEGVGLADDFTLKIGRPVPADFKVPEGYQVTDEPEYLCAAVVYTGPLSGLGQCWTDLGNGLAAEGYVTNNSGREYYLYWEGPESPNNVMLLASGIKP